MTRPVGCLSRHFHPQVARAWQRASFRRLGSGRRAEVEDKTCRADYGGQRQPGQGGRRCRLTKSAAAEEGPPGPPAGPGSLTPTGITPERASRSHLAAHIVIGGPDIGTEAVSDGEWLARMAPNGRSAERRRTVDAAEPPHTQGFRSARPEGLEPPTF